MRWIVVALALSLFLGAEVPQPIFAPTVPTPVFQDKVPKARFEKLPAPKFAKKREIDDGLSLVMVTSKSCGPCQLMKPVVEAIRGRWKTRFVDFDDPATKQWIEVYGVQAVPYFVTYRGHEALEVTQGVLSSEELHAWLQRIEQGKPPAPGGRFAKATAQDTLKPVDREYLQMRLTPGSCGMLGCMAHGGGWITETVPAMPDDQKPKGHWEERPGACPTCPSVKVWIADPDPTGTVPWPSSGGRDFFDMRRRR